MKINKLIRKFSTNLSSLLAKKSIYLDFQATTPLDFRVLDKMMPF